MARIVQSNSTSTNSARSLRETAIRQKADSEWAKSFTRSSKKTRGEAILVSDVGQHQMASARYYQFNKTNTQITSGGLGTMGFGLPASVGAALAAGDEVR